MCLMIGRLQHEALRRNVTTAAWTSEVEREADTYWQPNRENNSGGSRHQGRETEPGPTIDLATSSSCRQN
eukprot:2657959-Pyramimonas_sp.AAC.1